jgi:hypothetical protein
MIDIEAFRYPAIAVFSSALGVEAALTGLLFLGINEMPVAINKRWWAVFALAFMSAMNCYAAIEVYYKAKLDAALFTKLGFCLAGLNLVLWTYTFLKKFDARH